MGVFSGLAWLWRWGFRLVVALMLLLTVSLAVQSVIEPVSTLMLGRWLTGKPVDRRWVPLSAIAPTLKASVIMSEDGQFCRHHGVDWAELRDVMGRGRGPSRGASTITMQVVKNLFLWPGRSYLRKGVEIPLALVLDFVWTKRHIFEVYLNIAEWGDGVFGIEAAAQKDFAVKASALTLHEAALLATALPNPYLRHPNHPSTLHQALAARVARLADQAGDYVNCLK